MVKTIQEFIDKANELKAQAHAAEAKFLLYIRRFELDAANLWKVEGVSCFETFLQSTQLVNVARYRAFCNGCTTTAAAANTKGDESKVEQAVVKRGVDATIELGRFRTPTAEAVKQFDEYAGKFREVHGDAPSEQTSREWRKRLDGAAPRIVRVASRLSQLEAENQSLKAENRELKRKLANAEKELRGRAGARAS